MSKKGVMFYVLVGFKSTDEHDIEDAFRRIELLFRYGVIPYIMRYSGPDEAPWETSKYRHMYVLLARWCNQQSLVKKKSFRQFVEDEQAWEEAKGRHCGSLQVLREFEAEHPEIASRYFDIRFRYKGEEVS